jgi:hypothetical protein
VPVVLFNFSPGAQPLVLGYISSPIPVFISLKSWSHDCFVRATYILKFLPRKQPRPPRLVTRVALKVSHRWSWGWKDIARVHEYKQVWVCTSFHLGWWYSYQVGRRMFSGWPCVNLNILISFLISPLGVRRVSLRLVGIILEIVGKACSTTSLLSLQIPKLVWAC